MDVKTDPTPEQIETTKRQSLWAVRTAERKERRRKQRIRRGRKLT